MTIYTRNCYTYLIGWSHLNVWYYGAKYGKDANPDTFWINYYTSSKIVKDFRKEHGEPDVVQVRKTFGEDSVYCRLYEHKVLRRLDAAKSTKFLNRSIGGGKFDTTGMAVAKSIVSGLSVGLVSVYDPRWATGEIVSVHLGKTGIKHKNPSKFKDTIRGTAAARDISGNLLGLISRTDPRWATCEIVSVNLGITFSDKHKENIKLNHHDCFGENNSFYGKSHTEDTLRKIASRDYSTMSNAILVDGVEYRSIGEANRTLNIPRGILDRLLVSGKSHPTYNIGLVKYKINDDSLHQ